MTNFEKIKSMTLDELSVFFAQTVRHDIIEVADRYICRKCRADHNGTCPMVDDICPYDRGDVATVSLWLEGEAEE